MPPVHERDGRKLPDGARDGGLLQSDRTEGGGSAGGSGEASIGNGERPYVRRCRTAIIRCIADALVAAGFRFEPSPTVSSQPGFPDLDLVTLMPRRSPGVRAEARQDRSSTSRGDQGHEEDFGIGVVGGGSGRCGSGAGFVGEERGLQGMLRRQVRAELLPGWLQGRLLQVVGECTTARIAVAVRAVLAMLKGPQPEGRSVSSHIASHRTGWK
jgi:hypothetical protein